MSGRGTPSQRLLAVGPGRDLSAEEAVVLWPPVVPGSCSCPWRHPPLSPEPEAKLDSVPVQVPQEAGAGGVRRARGSQGRTPRAFPHSAGLEEEGEARGGRPGGKCRSQRGSKEEVSQAEGSPQGKTMAL